jgi:hypothetical protein
MRLVAAPDEQQAPVGVVHQRTHTRHHRSRGTLAVDHAPGGCVDHVREATDSR